MMKTTLYWMLACLVAAPLANAQSVSADNLQSRYLASSVRVTTNNHQEAEGLFSISGPLNITPSATSASAITGANLQRDEALALAHQFLRENETLLGASEAAFLLVKRNTDKFGQQHLRFQRTIATLPVADMEVIIHVDKNHQVTGVNGNIVRPTAALMGHMDTIDTAQLLTKEAAFNTVAELRNTPSQALRLLNASLSLSNSAPYIRWHMDVNSIEGIGRYSYWLNAETGELIDVKNTLRHPIPLNQ